MTPTVCHTSSFSGYKQTSQSTIEFCVFLIWICKADQLFPKYFGIGFAFQSCSAQFVAMSVRTLQFLRYRKEKVDLRSLFIAVSFRSVSDSDVTRKSESMTVGVMAGQLGNMAEEKLWNVVAFSPMFGEWVVSWSVCRPEEASGLLLASSWTDRGAWLDFMVESVWCVFPVNQDGFLILPCISSPSLTFHFL